MKTVVLPKGWFIRDVLKAAARVKRWDAPPRRTNEHVGVKCNG